MSAILIVFLVVLQILVIIGLLSFVESKLKKHIKKTANLKLITTEEPKEIEKPKPNLTLIKK